MKIACLGPEATFSHEAALAYLVTEKGTAEILLCSDMEDVVAQVLEGVAELGILPIKNSIAGQVHQAETAMADHPLKNLAEFSLPIRHFLLGIPGACLEEIRMVRSHPKALEQCSTTLSRVLRAVPVSHHAETSTAEAARLVSEAADPSQAAIASQRAAEHFGLEVLAENVQDQANNETTFLVFTRSNP